MKENKVVYKQYVAFINRETELNELRKFVNIEPFEILFLHGPKSSGKTTLLYRLFEQIEKEQKLDVKFLNLREICAEFTDDYKYEDFLRMLFEVDDKKEKKGKFTAGVNVGLFKINTEIEKKIHQGRVDPFKVMKKEFIQLKEKGIKPVLIFDELQALDKIYLNNGRNRQLIIELFNFFVAMTKESHLAIVIIASSDGYFLNTVYTDSRLKKSSRFYKVDYLPKEDIMEWLLNLEKYSKIKDYTLTPEDVEKIWDTVGGSMWEIHHILSDLFDKPVDDVLTFYKGEMKGIIAYYIGVDDKKEKILRLFLKKDRATVRDVVNEGIGKDEVDELLRDMVTNNILYFDPIEAIYYPQSRSYQWGIQLYFESLT
ncbi:MAG: AAA family ATPase [Candidatus Aminicenantes bacterium]|nr:AAA family ATPase [Candidatus Aminicenantes bacterium]NIM77272.1 AAA family ATPase [Candidatus Aminicenantes bacterium]NIN16573.1 AAA family ATPase [Candidatus Aminicenantes bacterium]NIN40431.1 AAA family ATPase [Candidatus Aminicenantes bacterium]NIN83251.1 AAA family ATPase [Candidatus Aminicenantes bacterium]